jgi:beta-glucanase (GH16 family)
MSQVVWGGDPVKQRFLSARVNPRTITKSIAIVFVGALLYFATFSLAIHKYALALPASWGLSNEPDGTVQMQAKRTTSTVHHNPSVSWNYNFASRPDGPLPKRDWNFETGTTVAGYNGELQTYTDSTRNIRVQNGTLILEALKQAKDGRQYTSARVNTYGAFDFTYGTLEVTMKVPRGNGTWPAAWMLPVNNRYKPAEYGINRNDPYAWALNGEVDFAESVGSIPGQVIPAIHSYYEVQRPPTYTPGFVPDSADTFHRYGVIKTPTDITFTLDGVPYATRHKNSNNPLEWPYDQPYYLIINLAIGGNWAGDKGVDDSTAPWQLQIKSINYQPLSTTK